LNEIRALGPDRLSFICLQAAYKVIPNIFHIFFKQLANNGYYPSTSTIAIIRKQNKSDYQNPKRYRLVALLNFLSKILEKIMANEIGNLAEQYENLHHQQIIGRR
jgi:hypothetical protein